MKLDRGVGAQEKRWWGAYGRREKKGREAGETGKLRNVAQYFAIEKAQRGGRPANKNRAGTGIKGYEKREVNPPPPCAPPHVC